ncbi:hypothetical protein ABW21_db0205048 [Orbilia brochopaga]|nr:hypothetical protein ABW21_db0205048 [Drechslerella brochopaga]
MAWKQVKLVGLLGLASVIPTVAAVTACNADNCLRQIRAAGLGGQVYCTNYLVTATPTVFAVHSGDTVEYITRKGSPYIAPNKRDVIPGSPDPVVTPEPLVRRQATPPAFASSCTDVAGNPNRFSSACTCLIGSTLEASVVTRTATQRTYTKTTDVCTYTTTRALRDSWQGDFRDRYASLRHVIPDPATGDVQQCCNICYHTNNCVAYYIQEDGGNCGILIDDGSSQPQPNDRLCNNGLLEIYDPEPGSFPGPYELGLCAYLVYSDE